MVKKKIQTIGPNLKRYMISNKGSIPLAKQCKLLGVNRSTYYYRSKQKNENLVIRNEVLEIYKKIPFYGSRRIKYELISRGLVVNRKRIQRIMRNLNIQAIYPKKRRKYVCNPNFKYPYLLRGITIDHPNQVWSLDITYIKINNRNVYLVAVIDWYSRHVLSWELSNSLDSDFCVAVLNKARRKYGDPEIINTDQGVQFTCTDFINSLLNSGIRISMDGKGRCLDNVFIERLWRSVKYEDVFIKGYSDFESLKNGLKRYFQFYNKDRWHMSLDYLTPYDVYVKKEKVKAIRIAA